MKFFVSKKKQKNINFPNDTDIVALHDYHALYFAIPKVANTSFKAYIVDLLGDQISAEYLHSEKKQFPFRDRDGRIFLKKSNILLNFENAIPFSHYRQFCFVRNPWDRLLSCYLQKIYETPINTQFTINGVYRGFYKKFGTTFYAGMKFPDFVDAVSQIPDNEADRHFRSQYTFFSSPAYRFEMNFIGYFERISKDFESVRQLCGFPPDIQFPHLLKMKRGDYKNYYSKSLIERVGYRYETDIKMFGYGFDSTPPIKE